MEKELSSVRSPPPIREEVDEVQCVLGPVEYGVSKDAACR